MTKQVFAQTTALVIDDDSDIVSVFSEYLEMHNIRVIGSGHNGKDAADLYMKLKPDVVFLDLMMPKYDGFYGLEMIKQQNSNAAVVMITADPTQESLIRIQNLGANAIIYKPFEIDEILAILQRLTTYEVSLN